MMEDREFLLLHVHFDAFSHNHFVERSPINIVTIRFIHSENVWYFVQSFANG